MRRGKHKNSNSKKPDGCLVGEIFATDSMPESGYPFISLTPLLPQAPSRSLSFFQGDHDQPWNQGGHNCDVKDMNGSFLYLPGSVARYPAHLTSIRFFRIIPKRFGQSD
jgi:hypothetical protein